MVAVVLLPTGQPLTPNRHDANSFLGPGQSSIVYLLMIDMLSGDTTCILST